MRILFVWPFYIGEEVPLGTLYLSSMVKPQGHQTAFFCLNPFPGYGQGQRSAAPEIKAGFEDKLRSFRPDLVGFSVISTGLGVSLDLAQIAKEHAIPVIFGGAHATVDPEDTLALKEVDMVCVGEGEHAFLELVIAMEAGGDITGIPNIWVKRNGQAHRNPPRPLISDLDSLPYPDRDILPLNELKKTTTGGSFITGRGCPYHCSYCINDHLQALYRGKGPFVRYRRTDSVVQEIRLFVEKAHPKLLVFSDEVFTLNKRRLTEFCSVYKKEIGLPFLCQTRANHIDEEVSAALKEAGCLLADVGIESGDDYISNKVLNRGLDRETIVRAFHLLKQAGIRTGSFNMIGMPGETEQTIWETINLNRQVRPDLVMCTILMPFKGTQIRKAYENDSLLVGEPHGDNYNTAIIKLPRLSPQKLVGYRYTFEFYVYSSSRLFPFIHMLRFLWSRVGEKRKWNNLHWRLMTLLADKLARKVLNATAYRWKLEKGI